MLRCMGRTGLVSCVLAMTVAAMGAEKQALFPQDSLSLRSFPAYFPIEFSPDGKWLAYTIQDERVRGSNDPRVSRQSSIPPPSIATDICIVRVETGETRNLTEGKGDNWLPAWSPDGRYLAFFSTRGGNGQVNVWRWQKDGGELEQVSDINVGFQLEDRIQWTPDSSRVVIAALEKNATAGVGERTVPAGPEQNGVVGKESAASTVILHAMPRSQRSANEPPRSDPWDLDSYSRQLAVVNLETSTVTSILRGQRIARYTLSPNGSYVAYTRPERFERAGSQQILFDLVVVSLVDDKEHVLARELRLNLDGSGYSWSPDSTELVFHTGGMNERNNDCFVVDIRDGNLRNVTTLAPLQEMAEHRSSAPLWDARGDNIYFIHQGTLWRANLHETQAVQVSSLPNRRIAYLISLRGNLLWTPGGTKSTVVVTHDESEKADGFYRIDLTDGTATRLLESSQCFTCVFGLQDYVTIAGSTRRAAYFVEDAQRDSDVWVTDFEFHASRRLTQLNPQLDNVSMGAARLVDWLSADGTPLKGGLLLPVGYESGKRYPMIVWIPGTGSMSDSFSRFGFGGSGPFNMQLFATRGYAVFIPDAPQHLATPMMDVAKAVLPGVNKVIELGIADPDRIGVMGHSRGAYNSLALIVQTTRFKAAIAVAGFADLVSAYGQMARDGAAFQTSVTEQGLGRMGGSPWQYRERYIENSPIFHLERIETPLLIIHGDDDHDVATFLGDELFVGMRRLGKAAEYAKYQGEGHSPLDWSYQNQIDFCNRVVSWFDAYLRGDHH
jgi:dipeptidyl aminopeptidase/acylaminoacyl peptidase